MKEHKDKPRHEIISPDGDFQKFFFDAFNMYEEDYTVKLYRVQRKGNKTYKTYLRKYENDVPDEDDVGNQFGGGHFWAVSNDLEGKTVCKDLWIDHTFTDNLLKKNVITPHLAPGASPPVPADPFDQFSKLAIIIKDLGALNNGNGNSQAGMGTMIEGIADAFTKGMGKIQNALIDKQLEKLEAPVPEPVSTEPSTKEVILDVVDTIKDFMGPILRANDAKAKKYSESIKQSDKFKQVQENPELYDAIYTEACNDPDIGQDKIDKIFHKLGFGQEQEQAAKS